MDATGEGEIPQEGSRAIISGIEMEAQEEVERILSEAKNNADQRREYAKKQAKSILEEAEKKAAEQSKAVKTRMLSGVAIEVRRTSMGAMESIFNEIIGRVKVQLGGLVRSAGYSKVICNWIIEAAVGLGAETALVNASADERALIDKDLLKEAEQKVEKILVSPVKLVVSDDTPLRSQGVMLTAANKRTAFNNQVEARLRRRQSEIRAMVYEKIFGE